MRSTLLLLLFATPASVLAFIFPGGEPAAELVGRVLATEKVGDFGRDRVIRWELWKAQVKVVRVTGSDTNIADRVSLFYTQDWSTNYVDITGVRAERPSRLRLGTNQVYEFSCHSHTNIKSEYDLGVETNGLCVLDGMIIPK